MSRRTRRAALLAGMVDESPQADSTMVRDMPALPAGSAMSQKLSVDPQVGAKQVTPLPASLDRPSTSAAQVESIQARAEPSVSDGGEAGVWWFGTPNYSDIAPWWSRQRDSDLRAFVQTEGNDILQSCIGSMVKKFKSMSWVLEGPEAKDKLDPEPGTVDYHQRVLSQAEFGEGWGELLTKSLQDYFSQDQGSYWELTGPGDPSGPLQSCPTGVECLDAQYVQPTGDPAYPILFHDVKRYRCIAPGCGGSASSAVACPRCSGPMQPTPHKVHASRMVHLVDLRSPNQQMNGVGFSAVSRVISSSQILLKLMKYQNEKLSDLPQAGLLLFNNILPQKWSDATKQYELGRKRLGQEIWQNIMTLFGYDPANPVDAKFISFAGIPDGFNQQLAYDIYVKIVALSFGVDIREFWPVSGSPMGTSMETLIMHQKARGKGVGEVISTIERAVNWKMLPRTVTFRFQFEDDEEERLKAEIQEIKTRTILSMYQPDPNDPTASPVSRDEVRQMLADETAYFRQSFLSVDTTDQTQVSDTLRKEYHLGRVVRMDELGRVTARLSERRKSVGDVLDVVESNYRAGKVAVDRLADFAINELLAVREAEADGKGNGDSKTFFGHAGRPGQIGGSAPGNVAMSLATGRDAARRQREYSLGKEASRTRKSFEKMQERKAAQKAVLDARDKVLTDGIAKAFEHGTPNIVSDQEFEKMWKEQLEVINAKVALDDSVKSDALKMLAVDKPVTIKPALSQGLRGDRRKDVLQASTELSSLASNPALNSAVQVDGKGGKRANYGMDGTVHLDKYSGKSTYAHEMGHYLEDKDPWVHQKALEFYERRTKGEQASALGDRYAGHEVARRDKFIDPYVGKDYGVYSNGKRYATEVISMGLQHYYTDPVGFAKADPEHFDLIYTALRGVQ